MIKMRKTTELQLSGKNFTIYHWPPSKTLANMPKIGRFLAVPLGTIAGSIATGGENFQDALPTALLYVFDHMDEGGLEVIDTLLEGIEVNSMGGKIDIDTVFEDNIMDLFTVLQKVIEINYGCFFSKSGFGNLQGLLAKFGMVREVQSLETTPEND